MDIYDIDTSNLDHLFATKGKGRPAKHPFASMKVGDIVVVDDVGLQIYVHVYASKTKRKYSTRVVEGKLAVKRIK